MVVGLIGAVLLALPVPVLTWVGWVWLGTKRSPKIQSTSTSLPSLLIPSYTSHARFLPTPSKHAFSYPLIYIGVDVDEVEKGHLDLPGRLFSYGGSPWSTVLGLRSNNYLTPGKNDFRAKLDELLTSQGIDRSQAEKVWLVSMPSLLGFEGLNPLAVWYTYDSDRRLTTVILEVSNTFGEKYVHPITIRQHSLPQTRICPSQLLAHVDRTERGILPRLGIPPYIPRLAVQLSQRLLSPRLG